MSKGNQEIRFRASEEYHKLVNDLQEELGTKDKSAGAKLLMNLGNDKIKDVVNYIDSVTHPLNDKQFNDLFFSLKIRILQKRKERISIKNTIIR